MILPLSEKDRGRAEMDRERARCIIMLASQYAINRPCEFPPTFLTIILTPAQRDEVCESKQNDEEKRDLLHLLTVLSVLPVSLHRLACTTLTSFLWPVEPRNASDLSCSEVEGAKSCRSLKSEAPDLILHGSPALLGLHFSDLPRADWLPGHHTDQSQAATQVRTFRRVIGGQKTSLFRNVFFLDFFKTQTHFIARKLQNIFK